MNHASLPARRDVEQTEFRRARTRFATIRTIGALMLREMTTQYARKPGGFIWAILQPLGTIIILAFAFSLLARSPALGTSFILFKGTGLLVFQLFMVLNRTVGASLRYARPLLAYPGVTWVDALLSRFFLNSLISILVMIIILSGIVLIEDMWLIPDWRMIILSVVFTMGLGFGIGTLHCFLLERFEIWQNIWGIMSTPLMLSSGIIILFEDMPLFAQQVLFYNPIVHVVGMMRAGFYSTYQPQYLSFTYVLFCTIIPLSLGLLLLRRYHRELLQR